MKEFGEFLLAKTRVLVVEDDDDLRLTLCEYLESRNFAVSSAPGGAEAIAMLQGGKCEFDIVVTDLVMPPGPDGLEVLRITRQFHPACYVLIVTGYTSIESAIEAIRRGAFDYVAKPFRLVELEMLLNRVKEHIQLRRDNDRLSRTVESLTEQFKNVDSRLERIEGLLREALAGIGTNVAPASFRNAEKGPQSHQHTTPESPPQGTEKPGNTRGSCALEISSTTPAAR